METGLRKTGADSVSRDQITSALMVRHAYKSYGSQTVLQGLSLTVHRGTIYGLLGTSGCGKTTLLNVIVGILPLDSGEIYLSVDDIKDIGYMPQNVDYDEDGFAFICGLTIKPQNVALFEHLQIQETLRYFGRIYGMTSDAINKKTKDLVDLLHLPSERQFVKDLSGGEQRRVSLACALVHNPQLLVLDEPTVGTDPLLRESIWERLFKLSKDEGKTILMTTHYIEEASRVDRIGILRGGVLLCEANPETIMLELDANSLEDVFLLLSKTQEEEENKKGGTTPASKTAKRGKPVYSPVVHSRKLVTKNTFLAEINKNVRMLQRNLLMLVFFFFVSLVDEGIFYFISSRDPYNLKIGYVDDEHVQIEEFCNHNKPSYNSCDIYYLSCKMREQMKIHTMDLVDYLSWEDARRALSKNQIWAYVHVPNNFSTALQERIDDELVFASLSTIRMSTVNVTTDGTNKIVQHILWRDLIDSFMDSIKDSYRVCGWNVRAIDVAMKVNDPVYGIKKPSYYDHISLPITALLLFTLPLPYVGLVCMEEKIRGLNMRSYAAGVSVLEIYLSHGVIQIFLHTFQTIFLTVFDHYTITTGICCGFLISAVSSTIMGSFSMLWGVTSLTYYVCGVLWPYEGVHRLLKPFMWVFPSYFTTNALGGTVFRGWGFSHIEVLKSMLSNVSWAIGLCLACCLVLRNRSNI